MLIHKNIFLTLFFVLGFCFVAAPSNTFAQSATPGETIISNLNSNAASIQESANQISQRTGLSAPQSNQLLQSIIGGDKVNVPTAASVIDGFVTGNLSVENFTDINNTINNLQNNLTSPEVAQDLINNLSAGFIPPEIGSALSLVNNLGNISDISDLESILRLPAFEEAFSNILENGGLPAEVTDLVSQISRISLDIEAFQNLAIAEIADQLSEALRNALPDIYTEILSQLGLTGIFETFSIQIFGEFSGIGSFNIAGSLAANYEIFDRDPKSDAVDKTCNETCNCSCRPQIERNHIEIRAHMTDEMIRNRTWMIDEFMQMHILPALMMMTEQLSAISMAHTYAVGKFFDAKHQMETERIFQQLMAQTHADYQPSVGLCEIASSTRGLIPSQEKAKVARSAFTNRMSERERRRDGAVSSGSTNSDILSRFNNFKEKYCNANDNGRGLSFLCQGSAPDNARRNKDVNITQTLYSEQTINADFVNPTGTSDDGSTVNNNVDGEDILAFSTNLFAPELNDPIARLNLATPEGAPKENAFLFMDLRSIIAKRSVAEDAFAAVVAERVSGEETIDQSFLRRIVVDLGVAEDEIDLLLGANPSYYAQRKVLGSYIFENPKFYTQLYESPANVIRKETAIKTLSLALEDDFFDRQLEEEAVLATILELMLEDSHSRTSAKLGNLTPEGEL